MRTPNDLAHGVVVLGFVAFAKRNLAGDDRNLEPVRGSGNPAL
jgi:hypothetical protein